MAHADVAVIGAGHNGLVAAVLMARAGLAVTVLEANPEPGGCIWTERLPSGHRLERGAIDHGQILDIAEELGLAEFGLEYRRRDISVGAAFGDGTSLLFPVASDRLAEEIPPADLPGYRRLAELGSALFDLIERFEDPPTPATLAAALRSAPAGDEIMRVVIGSADDVLSERLSDPHLISALAMYGAHSQVPAFMPGTGIFGLLLPGSHDAAPARPRGGSAALIEALTAALAQAGGRLELGARVVRIEDSGTGRTIVLADGRRIGAKRIVSSIDVRRTTGLLDRVPEELGAVAGSVHDGSLNVGEIKIDLALDRRPDLGPLERAPDAIWMCQQEIASLRRSYGEIIAGHIPSSPAFMWAAPSESDPGAAPEGGAVMWISAFMPLRPAQGPWTPGLEKEAVDRVLDGFERICGTDVRPLASTIAVTGPEAWAARLGSDTGNPNHLDLTLDQMMGWRPPVRTSTDWLYLSGAGTHPGGGLSGIPGRRAAELVIADVTGRAPSRSRGGRVASLKAALDIYRSVKKK